MNELELRCLKFAKSVRDFCKTLERDTITRDYVLQVFRSSSSIGANYIEANEKLGKQDLLMKLRIARKEAKKTLYWLELLEYPGNQILKNEVEELRRIFSAIITKVQEKQAVKR